jgi:hypothetical protein
MRIALALMIASMATAQQPDARELVRRSVEANDQNWNVARNYTFLEREEQRQLDSGGRVKSREVKTYDLTLLEGSPYRRLVELTTIPSPQPRNGRSRRSSTAASPSGPRRLPPRARAVSPGTKGSGSGTAR